MQQRPPSKTDGRPLTEEERRLIRWMLEHPRSHGGHRYLAQLERAAVVSRCPCGCASIDLAVDGVVPDAATGMQVIGDFEWRGPENEYMGAFLFVRAELLAGLDVWSVDGLRTPNWLPRPDQLRVFGEPAVA